MNRSTKEMWLTKERIIEEINGLAISGYNLVGRSDEGLVYESVDGLGVVIKVMCKQKQFKPQREVDAYECRESIPECNQIRKAWKKD